MSRDESKLPPPPPRGSLVDGTGTPRVRPGGLFAVGNDEEEVDDENTWVANGSPYLQRETTAEVSYFDEHDTNIDWNSPSDPAAPRGASEDTLNFELRTTQADGMPTDYGTEPGITTDTASLSALRDAMRTPKSPAPLPLPAPRARTNPGVRPVPPPPPVRRVGQPGPQAVVHPVRARVTPPVRGRNNAVGGLLLPVLAGVVALLVIALLVARVGSGTPDVDVEAPMLPVVGGPPPKTLPVPPFDVPAPAAWRPEQTAGGPQDVDALGARVLLARGAGDAALAAAWSDRLVRTAGRPALFFDHAALLADVGQVDAAFYWLVRGAQEHGYPAEWLVQRRAFRRLWVDPRWDAFVRWVIQVGRYHAERGPSPATIVLPGSLEDAATKAAARGTVTTPTALPVVVYLDQVGGNGSAVLEWGQKIADELGVVVVGVGGPERVGPAGSWWTGDLDRDRAQVDNALAAVLGVSTDPARRYLVGVGQGGQYAVELVLRSPGFAAGALVVAPTDDWKGPRDAKAEIPNGPRTEKVLLTAGSLPVEAHTLLRLDNGRLRRAGIETELRIDDKPWGWPDGVPADFGDRLAAWLRERLAKGAVAPPVRAAGAAAEAPSAPRRAPAKAPAPSPAEPPAEPPPLPAPLGPGTAPPPAAKAPPPATPPSR